MPHLIDHLLQQPEGKALEFKCDLSSLCNVLKALVAHKDTAAGQVFDGQPMPELTLDDPDTTATARVFGPTRTLDEKSLRTLKLLRTVQGRLVPARGAVLQFGKAREQHLPNAWIQCGRFRGLDRVGLFDDRIDIESPDLLLPGMTIEDMRSGVSHIRNPVIARVFCELGLIEQWGSGIRRIFDEASRLGLPEPVIEEIATGVRLQIRLAQPHALNQPPSDSQQSADNGQVDSSRLESKLAARLSFNSTPSRVGKPNWRKHCVTPRFRGSCTNKSVISSKCA